MSISPQILSEAMGVYVHTFPRRDRLIKYITKRGLEGYEQQISTELDAVLSKVEGYLREYPGGVLWSEPFERGYRKLLLEWYTWLDTNALDRVIGFSKWMCWHDGLNAGGT